MSRFGYLLPFTYFWSTRLRKGSLSFHVVFEWLAAAVLVVALTPADRLHALLTAFLAYIAFISLYEIGYMANDLVVAPKENGGRTRGPQGARGIWIGLWVLVRLIAFGLATLAIGRSHSAMWWLYFAALAAVFAFHNLLKDAELKSGTFLWLSWFRFMAPVVFVVPSMYVMGIGMACAMSYSAFRQFGYLDSKGLLQMPGRQRPLFRWAFFMWPLLPAGALATIPEAKGLVIIFCFYAVVATLGVVTGWRRVMVGKDS